MIVLLLFAILCVLIGIAIMLDDYLCAILNKLETIRWEKTP